MQRDNTGRLNGIVAKPFILGVKVMTYSRMHGSDCALQMSGIVCETNGTDNSAKLQCTH